MVQKVLDSYRYFGTVLPLSISLGVTGQIAYGMTPKHYGQTSFRFDESKLPPSTSHLTNLYESKLSCLSFFGI